MQAEIVSLGRKGPRGNRKPQVLEVCVFYNNREFYKVYKDKDLRAQQCAKLSSSLLKLLGQR